MSYSYSDGAALMAAFAQQRVEKKLEKIKAIMAEVVVDKSAMTDVERAIQEVLDEDE